MKKIRIFKNSCSFNAVIDRKESLKIITNLRTMKKSATLKQIGLFDLKLFLCIQKRTTSLFPCFIIPYYVSYSCFSVLPIILLRLMVTNAN